MIDQMSDFVKGRTTLTSRIEEVEDLEPPTVMVCLNPPFKPTKLALFGMTNNYEPILANDYNNNTLKEWIDFFTYKLGQDFSINMQLTLGTFEEKWNVSVGVGSIGNFSFEVRPVITFYHGKCYKIQPHFTISSPDFRLYISISFSSAIDEVDVPGSIIFHMTSSNSWQGIVTNDWPQFTPSKVELDRPSWGDFYIYNIKPTEYLFDQGIDSSEECFLKHILRFNCTSKCVFADIAPLPICNSREEASCIIDAIHKYNLWTKCNLKKRALTYPGEITKMINTMKNQSSRTLTLFEIGIFSFFKLVKEEIDVITFADLIGSLGGSLGMFFGFSISTCVIYLLDKCIMYIVHNV